MPLQEQHRAAFENLRSELTERTLQEGLTLHRGHWSIFWDEQGQLQPPQFVWLDNVVEDLGVKAVPEAIRSAAATYDLSREFLVLLCDQSGTSLCVVPLSVELAPTLVNL
jgi:hypothetical protein